MTNTSILTFDQGIQILIEFLVFFILYSGYYYYSYKTLNFTNITTTVSLFILWKITLIISQNIVLALSVNLTKSTNI